MTAVVAPEAAELAREFGRELRRGVDHGHEPGWWLARLCDVSPWLIADAMQGYGEGPAEGGGDGR